jgi:two-component system, OmpR family, alkaline phosphatase synthesis response regulator PhoP
VWVVIVKGIEMSQTKSSVLKRKRILVVEDEADFLELLRLRFKEEGYAIATAQNGIDAVKKARSLLPDLILLDVMLPELDGFAVCEILRNDSATAGIPVIMVTGLCGQMPRCAGIESGATDFVTKPTSPDEIVSKVKERLQRRSQPAPRVLSMVKSGR